MYIININDAWKDMQLQNFTSQGSNFYFHLSFEKEFKRIDHWLAMMMTMKDVCHIKPPPNNM